MAGIALILFIVACVFIFRRSTRKLRTVLYMLLALILTVPAVATLAIMAGITARDAGALALTPALLIAMLVGLIHSRRTKQVHMGEAG